MDMDIRTWIWTWTWEHALRIDWPEVRLRPPPTRLDGAWPARGSDARARGQLVQRSDYALWASGGPWRQRLPCGVYE